MTACIAYFRVSTNDQSIEAQRAALGESFDKEFCDEGVSGTIHAAERPGFADLLKFVREGDTVFVYAVDRLGRDALDVQSTVRALLDKGVSVHVRGLGLIGRGVGELISAVLAQVADMERQRIKERCDSGRAAARASLALSGKTHKGKASLGRPFANDARKVRNWREENDASIAQTAEVFGLSVSTVKRYCQATAKIDAIGTSQP
jgi:putative DNA-invertase from lambdoid prophage Rac